MEQNRIYQLTTEQFNVISSDLLEAIILLSGKKDKSGLLDELNVMNDNLEVHLSKEKTIVNDLTDLYEKVKTDEKLKVKIKEIELNNIDVKNLIDTIDRLEKTENNIINIATLYKQTSDLISKNILSDVVKIETKISDFLKAQNEEILKIEKKEKEEADKLKKQAENIKVEKKINLKILGAGIFLGGFGLGLTSILILLCTKLSFQEAWYISQKLFL